MQNKITPESVAGKYDIKLDSLRSAVGSAQRAMKPVRKEISVVGSRGTKRFAVVRNGVGMLVSQNTRFYQFEFRVNDRWKRYSVIFAGSVDADFNPVFKNRSSIILRVDSGCETGQIAGDVTCDCRKQLIKSMEIIAGAGEGMVIRIPMQEGKGTGMVQKLAAHLLENRLAISNVEAAYLLSNSKNIDTRTYDGAIAVLKFLGAGNKTAIKLLTNNPKKLVEFRRNGYRIWRMPLRIKPNRFTKIHLRAKQDYLGHIGLV